MQIAVLKNNFSVCKMDSLPDCTQIQLPHFLSVTEEEISLVCPTQSVPPQTMAVEHGWKAFQLVGILDFSLVGILSKIATLLAEAQISIFALSTYNTDYILVKEDKLSKAIHLLTANHYDVLNAIDIVSQI